MSLSICTKEGYYDRMERKKKGSDQDDEWAAEIENDLHVTLCRSKQAAPKGNRIGRSTSEGNHRSTIIACSEEVQSRDKRVKEWCRKAEKGKEKRERREGEGEGEEGGRGRWGGGGGANLVICSTNR